MELVLAKLEEADYKRKEVMADGLGYCFRGY
jgi:hypothetical protein